MRRARFATVALMIVAVLSVVLLVRLLASTIEQRRHLETAPTEPPASTVTSITIARPTLPLALAGTGFRQGIRFTVPPTWQLAWWVKCSDPDLYRSTVIVAEPVGRALGRHEQPPGMGQDAIVLPDQPWRGHGVEHYQHRGGTWTLNIGTACTWRVVIRG